jgi:hypothetical protein
LVPLPTAITTKTDDLRIEPLPSNENLIREESNLQQSGRKKKKENQLKSIGIPAIDRQNRSSILHLPSDAS